ncbi:MAG: response regulator [Actinobacteria bacterium]|nr:response regulator [Actinomycetota bacterium]
MADVLIVEDDAIIAHGMATYLRAAGFRAHWVRTGESGLARLRYRSPDVCLLDPMLPE